MAGSELPALPETCELLLLLLALLLLGETLSDFSPGSDDEVRLAELRCSWIEEAVGEAEGGGDLAGGSNGVGSTWDWLSPLGLNTLMSTENLGCGDRDSLLSDPLENRKRHGASILLLFFFGVVFSFASVKQKSKTKSVRTMEKEDAVPFEAVAKNFCSSNGERGIRTSTTAGVGEEDEPKTQRRRRLGG